MDHTPELDADDLDAVATLVAGTGTLDVDLIDNGAPVLVLTGTPAALLRALDRVRAEILIFVHDTPEDA